MKRKIVKTADGSYTFKFEGFKECFHSINGAYTESMHIFIQNGLRFYIDNLLEESNTQVANINILEVGFGTGLNCILTAVSAKEYPNIQIKYNTIEKHPLTTEEFEGLQYKTLFTQEWNSTIDRIHACSWDQNEKINDNFVLLKKKCKIEELQLDEEIAKLQLDEKTARLTDRSIKLIDGYLADIVYYDAFSPNIQPHLWSRDLFKGVYNLMNNNAVLVTYSAKGDVKRALRDAGFYVIRKKGPPGKRHITVARKIVREVTL